MRTVTNWREFGDAISEAIGFDKVGQCQPIGNVEVADMPGIRRVIITVDLILPRYEATDQDIPF